MANQAAKAEIHFAFGRHHRCIELRKGFDQMWLSLHREHAVGCEAQGAQEKIEV